MSGLHIKQLQSVLKDHQPITVTLGNTGVFEQDDKDVVYIEVLGNELHHLHHSLKEALPNTQTFPNYKPHITIAYVKPGLGKQYANKLNTLKGREVTLNALTFSDKDRQQVHLPLGSNSQHAEKRTDPNIYYHGSPSGDLRGASWGLHIGTHQAAHEALTARIGYPVHGSWDGSREYGKTLLAGKKTLKERGIFPTGYNVHAPEHDYYPHQHKEGFPSYGGRRDEAKVAPEHKPTMLRVRIKGEMTNTHRTAHPDFKANGYMKAAIKKGNAKRGYYYKNDAEDAGSISAVVPHHSHLEILDNSQHTEVPNKIKGGKGDGKNISKFDPEQIAKGIKVEMEHTDDPSIALEIAIDHLTEDEHYYDKLAKVESSQHAEDGFKLVRQFGYGWIHPDGKVTTAHGMFNHADALLNTGFKPKEGAKKPIIDQGLDEHHVHITTDADEGGNTLYATGTKQALHKHKDTIQALSKGRNVKHYTHDPDKPGQYTEIQFSDAVDFNPHRLLAPPGGVTVHGVKYNPGQHIPHQVINALHPEHKARLVAGTIARHIQANPQLAKEQTHGSQEPHQPGHRTTGQTQGGGLPGSRGVSGSTSKLGTQGTPSAQHSSSLEGLPTRVKIPGHGEIQAKHSDHIREVAKKYMESAKLPYDPPKKYAKVDPERAKRIAAEYHSMKHDPHHPDVKKAYEALANETMAQWEAIKKHGGLKVSFIPHGSPDPYAKSPRLATEDIHNNNHMWVFPTDSGFGSSEADVSHNPLLKETNETISGKRARLNDIFRIVHDYFGHAKEGVGFRADGEENAWRMHSAMYSPLARKAMTTETRGQNSWVNFGPHGEANKKASSEKTVFADQKTGLLPDWVHTEGHHDHDISQHSEEYLENYVDRGMPFNGDTFQLAEENYEVHEHGKHFKTGVPVTFNYSRNTKPSPNFGETYQQHIEPHGRYMLHTHPSHQTDDKNWEHGTVTFKNPLVIPLNSHSHLDPNSRTYDEHSWKANLQAKYKAKGKALSKKLAAMGHDGIVTLGTDPKGKPYDTREIVDLSSFHQHSQHAEHDESEPLPYSRDEVDSILKSDNLAKRKPVIKALFSHYVNSKSPPAGDFGQSLWGEIHEPHRWGPGRVPMAHVGPLYHAHLKKHGKEHNSEMAKMGEGIINDHQSQHSEQNPPLLTTLSSQIDTAQVNLLALSNSSLGLTELAVIAQKELDKLKEPLHKHLVIGGLQGAIEGAKETVALIGSLPKDHKEYLSKRYSLPPTIPTLDGSTPLQPPQTPTGGLGALGGEIPPRIVLPDLEAAVAKLGALPSMVGTDWTETAELVKSGAFAITADLEQRQVQEIKEILTEAVANGSSQKEFIEEVNNKVFESGDGTLSKAHLENIFRTNALSAKSDAKLKTINSPMVKSAFPYARVSTTEDDRRRPTHKAIAEMGLDGTNFYNMDDPFFRKYRGPWFFQCRCTWTGTTVEQASRNGVLEAVEWKQRAEEKANKEGGSYYQYLEDTKPKVFKYVDHPEFQEPSFHDNERT